MPFARIGSDDASAGFAIRMDDGAAAEAATAHLIGLGHKRIGFIAGSAEYRLSGARTDGYRAAMAAAGLSIDDGLIQPGDFSFESGEAAMRAWLALAEPVTAAIASSEQMALGALHVARDRGVDVPAELPLGSFHDTPDARSRARRPPLTHPHPPP